MPHRWAYWGACLDSTYEDIWALKATETPVTWRTFRQRVPGAFDFFVERGAFWDDTTNKNIEDSYFIAFFKGVFMGQPCYFARWSGIEFIWLPTR
jgi:hypothetical protein